MSGHNELGKELFLIMGQGLI